MVRYAIPAEPVHTFSPHLRSHSVFTPFVHKILDPFTQVFTNLKRGSQCSFLALGRRSTPARAAAAWSKRYDPLLRHGFENADGLGSLGYQTGRQSLHRTSMDRLPPLPRVAKFQTGKGAGCDVTESVNAHTW